MQVPQDTSTVLIITLERGKHHHFCLFCHQKWLVEFGEWLCASVLKRVLHLTI